MILNTINIYFLSYLLHYYGDPCLPNMERSAFEYGQPAR